MRDDRCRLERDDRVIGLDLASAEHQVVALTGEGQEHRRYKGPVDETSILGRPASGGSSHSSPPWTAEYLERRWRPTARV